MQITVYSLMEQEQIYYEEMKKKYDITFVYTKEMPTSENLDLSSGSFAVIVITTPITKALIEGFSKRGVQFISTRTAGYDHMDLAFAKTIQMGMGNSSYDADNVAEYTVMMILMAMRHMKTILFSYQNQDFSLKGVQGNLLKGKTVGLLGTGKIGSCVAELLHGFGCEILAYNRSHKEALKEVVTYVSYEELLKNSDILSLHLPATQENYHLINEEAIQFMKQDALIVNTARGSLIDTSALIHGLETGKLAAAALDVMEDETPYYYHSFKEKVIAHHDLAILRSMPNVILTPHTAFHTRQASIQMAQNAVISCIFAYNGTNNPWQIV